MNLNRVRSVVTALAVLLSFAGTAAQAQQAVITGRVATEEGTPLAGANVVINELNISVGTNAQGQYNIQVQSARVANQNVVVRARAIGYAPAARNITLTSGSQVADFSLRRDVSRLAEVVVTGVSGATEQAKIPFKVDRLSAADFVVTQSDPISQIHSKVPGATIVSATGRPGGVPSIILRAPTSINGTGRGQGPVIFVDGVLTQSGVADVNSEDIESIEVVKGAAAASLYGAYAGRGVINIRTKSGRSSAEGVRFHVRTEYGRNDIEGEVGIAKSHSLLLDETGQLFCIENRGCNRRVNWENEALRVNDIPVGQTRTLSTVVFPNDPSGSIATALIPHTFLANRFPEPTVNPARDFVDPNDQYTTQLDMTGRFGGTSVYSSVNRTRVGGALPSLNGSSRSSGRLNVDQQIGDKWSGSFRMYYSRLAEDGANWDSNVGGLGIGGPFFRITRQNRKSDLDRRDSKGRLFARSNLIASGSQNINPLHALDVEHQENLTNRFLGSGDLRWTPLPWLDLQGTYSYDGATGNYIALIDKGRYINTGVGATCEIGCMWTGSFDNRSYNTGANATARWSFGDLNTRTALNYGFLRQDFSDEDLHGRALAVAGLRTLDAALEQTTKSVSSNGSSIRGIGFYLSESLDWKDRYIFDAVIRRDGSSLFGSENRWKWFGRGAVAWRVAQEPWWFVPAIDEFKLRFSRGSAGGRPSFSAQYEAYALSAAGVAPFTFGNKFLKPEVTLENEFGVDVQFFGRYALSVTRAMSETRDQILLVPLPSSVGFRQQWRNAGTLDGRSWEASLDIPLIISPDVNWSTRFTYDRAIATITELDVPPFTYGTTAQATSAMFNARVGERLGTFYGKHFLRGCAELPAAFQGDCGGESTAFQINDDGYLVWVGAGNSWREGITKNLWGTGLYCPPPDPVLGSPVGTPRCNTTPYGYPIFWGMPIVLRDSTGAAIQAPLGNALPDYKWTASTNFNWRGLTAYVLFDAVEGKSVWNQGRHWSYLESINLDQDQAGKSVETAKPIAYYWRAAPPDHPAGLGGFYDILGPNNQTTDDASYIKLREVSLGYNLGRIGGLRGDWRVNVIGRNLHTWTDYRGWDPEVGTLSGAPAGLNSPGSPVIAAIDAFGFPNLRSITFSLSTTF